MLDAAFSTRRTAIPQTAARTCLSWVRSFQDAVWTPLKQTHANRDLSKHHPQTFETAATSATFRQEPALPVAICECLHRCNGGRISPTTVISKELSSMTNMNFKAAAAVAALSALFLAGCSDGAKQSHPPMPLPHLQPLRRRRNLQQHHLRLRILPLPHSPAAAACR